MFWSYSKFSLFTKPHAHNTDIPAFDDLTNANYYFERFSIIGAIKDGSIQKAAFVVNQDFLAFFRTVSWFTLIYNFFRYTLNKFDTHASRIFF